ncbi:MULTISPECIES: hypothetical protein [unclassified Nocardiopsis]|uniref:hypothetical protein n=1 Tax=unclassified Nocardiopsis TaxID=2649073 RepID=UPI00135AB0BD|nr:MULTISPECIES: hypothetical protein [unclassified Nocardiopsis]
MAVKKMKLTEKIESKLGEEGIQELAAHLWARDCQTCGGSLGVEPPALYVIDMHTYAFAELNHEECRAPDWNDSGLLTGKSSSDAHLSHEALSVVLPFSRNGAMDLRPALLVNPGLESVMIQLDDQDRWQVKIGKHFEHAGLRPVGQIPMDSPVKGVTAHLTHFEIAVTLQGPPFSTYSAPIGGPSGPQIRDAHADKQGVLLMVSHLFDFTTPTPDHISSVFASGKLLSGWVGFAKNDDE